MRKDKHLNELLGLLKWLVVSLIKCTGVFLVLRLFCPTVPYYPSCYIKHWVYLYSPVEINGKYHWLVWVQRCQDGSGSSSETAEFWWVYYADSIRTNKDWQTTQGE